MKPILKWTLRLFGGIFLLLFLALFVFIFFTGPKLPSDTHAVIQDVLTDELPDLVGQHAGFVESAEGYEIWYERIPQEDTLQGTVLLFMGISNDGLAWPSFFLNSLTGSGYEVIRYDYRGTGMSDWVENWKESPYSLEDLATDACIILDSLGVEKVHLFGVSMGGMVAQEFAIHNPERTATLTCLMSTGNILDPELPPISTRVSLQLLKVALKYGLFPSEKNTLKLHIAAHVILRGDADYKIDLKDVAQSALYNLRKRRGYNKQASPQHQQAVRLSGSRYAALKNLQLPALIVHGKNDPFVPIEHSRKLASVIPGAKAVWIENMGHDIPKEQLRTIMNALATLINP